jgi:hypothetical protein
VESLEHPGPDQGRSGAPWFQSPPLGLSAQEVDAVLPLLDSARAKISQLEEVVDGRQEEEGRALAEAVAEHVLLCLHSRDPKLS